MALEDDSADFQIVGYLGSLSLVCGPSAEGIPLCLIPAGPQTGQGLPTPRKEGKV